MPIGEPEHSCDYWRSLNIIQLVLVVPILFLLNIRKVRDVALVFEVILLKNI